VLGRAGYAACLPDAASVDGAVLAFAEGGPLSVMRQSDRPGAGIGKRVDVRRSLSDVAVASAELAERVGPLFGWPADRLLTFGVAVSAEGSARPREVLEALLGPGPAAVTELARVALEATSAGPQHSDPLHPAALRRPPGAPRSSPPADA
jgi:hypothetical protein